jgi:NAD(P)-dependent dehydrogenase (short-subunit alcohol dehydrogenase family)
MTPAVAIVTGGSSGIGLALVQHLVDLKWNVVIADLNPPKASTGGNTLFIKTDIGSWDQQADMFRQAHDWGKRLDFVALNAGIDDRDDIFNTLSHDLSKPPRRPSTATFNINISGTYESTRLDLTILSLLLVRDTLTLA